MAPIWDLENVSGFSTLGGMCFDDCSENKCDFNKKMACHGGSVPPNTPTCLSLHCSNTNSDIGILNNG